MKVLHQIFSSFRFFTKFPLIGYAGALGVIVVLLGALSGSGRWSNFLMGTGSSLIAASIYSFVNYAEQKPYRQFAALGIRGVYAYRTKVDPSDWCRWLAASKRHCVLFGIANHNWCEDPNFEQSVREATHRQTVEVKVFFLDPTSGMATLRSREEQRAKARNTVNETRASIQYMWNLRNNLDNSDRVFFRMFVYEGTPSGTNWFDDSMIVTHYLAGSANLTSPSLKLQLTGGAEDLFHIYKENIEKIEQYYSTEITEANIEKYV